MIMIIIVISVWYLFGICSGICSVQAYSCDFHVYSISCTAELCCVDDDEIHYCILPPGFINADIQKKKSQQVF